jgi:5-methylcytosine-specific restriction endonuclease McrA
MAARACGGPVMTTATRARASAPRAAAMASISTWCTRCRSSSRLWPPVRRLVLVRDGGRCQIRRARCTLIATAVDHVVPLVVLAERGELRLAFDPANLRAACSSCNASEGAKVGNPWRRGERARRRRFVPAEEAAIEWGKREDAYWRALEERERRQAPAPRRTPRIY